MSHMFMSALLSCVYTQDDEEEEAVDEAAETVSSEPEVDYVFTDKVSSTVHYRDHADS